MGPLRPDSVTIAQAFMGCGRLFRQPWLAHAVKDLEKVELAESPRAPPLRRDRRTS